MSDYNVIIVGAGGAGLAAAITAREQGASCLILEAADKPGGATALCSGVMYAANTSVQTAAGIEGDTAEAMFQYVMTLAGWEAEPRIFRRMADDSGPTIEWLKTLGVDFPPAYLTISGVETVPRGHVCPEGGWGIARELINAAGAAGALTVLKTRVDTLITTDGVVRGVVAGGTEVTADAVIVTTGGFGNSPEMIRQWYPTAASHGDWTYAVHMDAPFILGDGIRLGESVGAAIVGRDTGLLLPTSGLGKFIEAFLPPWVLLVNDSGVRFMNEAAPYAVSGYLINAQHDRLAFALFDESALRDGSQDVRFSDPYGTGAAMPTWEHHRLRRAIADGRVIQAATGGALAEALGIHASTLGQTVARYNLMCDKGADTDYFKITERFFPLREAPFYARAVRASVIGQTGAGLNIDECARVLDTHGQVIPGLYAAGEVLGCAVGKRYSGGGMGVCNAMVFGRLAGREAARSCVESKPVG